MNADSKLRAWYTFVSAVVLCAIAAAGWAFLLAIGSGMKGWGDGSGVYPARPIADFVGAVCPIITLILAAAAFYPGISKKSYRWRIGVASVSYLAFLAALVPAHSAEAGMGLLFGIVGVAGCLAALKSLRQENA